MARQLVTTVSRPDSGLTREVFLDWNESPLGPPPAAVERVRSVAEDLHKYPRGLLDEVTSLVADYLGVETSSVLLTAGVDEAVDLTLSLAARAWGIDPGFDGYPDRVAASGKEYLRIAIGPDWLPSADPQVASDDVVYVAQPGNPTGTLVGEDWLRRLRSTGALILVDETYTDFASAPSFVQETGSDERLLVYRSFSKAMGLAGIRVGCVVGHPDVVGALEPLRRFMPLDAVSLSAAAGLLSDPGFIESLASHVIRQRPELARFLRESGLFSEVRDTEANFVMAMPTKDSADRLRAGLAAHRIRVKECSPLGLPGWLRISVGSLEDHQRLATCLAGV